MRRIADDEAIHQLGMEARERPSDDPSPVVPADVRARASCRAHERGHVRDEMTQVVRLTRSSAGPTIIAAQVRHPHREARLNEWRHLLTP